MHCFAVGADVFAEIDWGRDATWAEWQHRWWWLYADLKKWQLDPDAKRARALRARFERLFTRRTGYVMLDRLLTRLHHQKADLLRVLERPEIPLHTNGSENDIRAFVTKRKISGGTVSEKGRQARDVMLGLAKTCMKLKIPFFDYLGARLGIDVADSVGLQVDDLPVLGNLETLRLAPTLGAGP